jgi:outer membrane protein assembly factor BamB
MLSLLVVSAMNFVRFDISESKANAEIGQPPQEDWWTMFRHDVSHTGHSSWSVPTPIAVLESFPTNGEVRSSPAVYEDTVFVGSGDGCVYKWSEGASPFPSAVGVSISSSPLVDETYVYVGLSERNVTALLKANLARVGRDYRTGGQVGSSPMISEGMLYAGCSDGYVYAWDIWSTTEKWRFRTAAAVESTPVVFNDTVIFGAVDGRIYAVEKSGYYGGRLRWYTETGGAIVSSPAVASDIMYVGSNDSNIYAFNATNGHHIWNYTTYGPVASSPAIANGAVFVGSDDGFLYALNATAEDLTPTERLLWRNGTGGRISSSPAVTANGIVFVGSYDKKIYAFNASNGNQIWSSNATDGEILSSPAIANGRVYIGSNDGKVYIIGGEPQPPVANITLIDPATPAICTTVQFDGTGIDPDNDIANFTWDFGDGSPNVTKTYASVSHVYEAPGTCNVNLTVVDRRGLNDTDSRPLTVSEAWPMFRHDPKHWANSTFDSPITNNSIWNQVVGSVDYSSPAVTNDTVFIGTTDGFLRILNATTGEIIRSITVGDHIHSSPAVFDRLIFVASENGTVSAWDVDGNPIWLPYPTNYTTYCSPNVVNGKVFIGNQGGRLHALDMINGNPLWPFRILDGLIDSTPAVSNGRVFVGTGAGTVYAIDETDGHTINQTATGLEIHSSPTVADDKVFIGAGSRIFAFDLNCNRKWDKPTGGSVYSSPAVADGVVFVGSRDGRMYAFDAQNGNPKWISKTLGEIYWSSPAVADGRVFIGSKNGTIYALRAADGEILWSYQMDGSADSSPAVYKENVFIGSGNKLWAFGGRFRDVAVLNVTSQAQVILPNTAYINVTLRNKGNDEINITVTAQYDDSVFNSTNVTISENEDLSFQIPWNTMNVSAPESYTIRVNATISPDDDYNPTDNTGKCTIEVVTGVYDIAITEVIPSSRMTTLVEPITFKDLVGQNLSVTIWVTVNNTGDFPANDIHVGVYWSNATHNQTIGTIIIPVITKEKPLTLNITWYINTTGIPLDKGNYTITAYAQPIPYETNKEDNVRNATRDIRICLTCDVTNDGYVGIDDLFATAIHFGGEPNPLGWAPNYDLNNDGYIGIDDTYMVARNFGMEDP